jgi:two-component system sensor histidine kinase SenX3
VISAADFHAAAIGAAALIGLALGTTAALAFRWSERDRAGSTPAPEPLVPPGAVAVLSVLRSSAVLLDPSDAVVKASPAAHALGLVHGQTLASDVLLGIAREVRRTGEIQQRELDLERPARRGGVLAVSVRVAPLGSQLVLVLVEDRTEARRVDEIRRDFVANVSHELKTPVGALSLLSEAVQAAAEDPDGVRRFAGRMQKEAHRLSSLVQDLIDLSQVQSDGPLANASPVEIDDAVGEALDRSRNVAASRGIELITSGTADLRVLGSYQQLVTAIGNLVENAVNYSPNQTRVVVATRLVDDFVEVCVTDQGIGIPEHDLERIFERFYRVDPARSRATGGTGLGLSIVKHIAATHGGDVSVWSQQGSGSSFTLRLPMLVGVEPDTMEVPAARPRVQVGLTSGGDT